MCAIAGTFAYRDWGTPVDRHELRTIRDHMASRGPDGAGEWYSPQGHIGLAHRRLSIIDLSERGAQPMFSADGQLVVTFNGEIYNYRQLRAALEARGRQFASDSDTEVLLHLYAEKGEAMLHDLRGMFAFAIWDVQRQSLFLARDPFGIKPLYYADDGRTFRFASQVKALLTAPVDTRPQPAGHAGFFLWGSVPEPWTLYRGISGLPAGHWMRVTAESAGAPVSYHCIGDTLRHAAVHPAKGDRETAVRALAAAMGESVRAHQVADVPVGIFLSSGVDSGVIASAASIPPQESRTITLGFAEFAGTANDEVPLAEEVARAVGAWHATLMVSRHDFEAERERLLQAMDQPTIDGVNTWFVARAAQQMGLKVALSGLGGDELFATYPSFRDIPRLMSMTRAAANFPRLGRLSRRLSAPFVSAFTSPKFASVFEYGPTVGGAYLLRRALHMPWELAGCMDPEMAREGLESLATLANLTADAEDIWPSRLAVSSLEMGWYMRNQLLRDADWAGMAHSLEIRVPFVDLDLLAAAAPWLSAHPDIRKSEVAAVLAPNLPHRVLNRPKTGFTVPVRDWIRRPDAVIRRRGLRGWAEYIHGAFSAPAREATP
jgi:asparagine synthase (glutamine-hydrolysing)